MTLGFVSGSIFASNENIPEWWPAKYWFGRFRSHLGLDLQGGAHLVYEADTSKVSKEEAESAIAGVRDVIEKRVNALGVSEPIVQTSQKDDSLRLIVELAGVFDVNKAIEQIGATPLLEFKTEAQAPEPVPLSKEEKTTREKYNKDQLKKAKDAIKKIKDQKGQNFAELATELSSDYASAENGGDLGYIRREVVVAPFGDALFDKLKKEGEITEEPVETVFGYHIIQRLDSKSYVDEASGSEGVEIRARHILFPTQSLEGDMPAYDPWASTGLGGKQLKKSEIIFDQYSGVSQVGLDFDDEGSDLFEKITEENIGKRIAIFLDGSIISAPTVQQKISGGKAVITGNFSITEAKELVNRLNSGALPVPINLINQQTVGPTLGQVSIQKSLIAGIIGFILVAIFMILIYRFAGILAVVSLAFYSSIVFTLFKLIPVTLTLAGISGFLLSIGMAVDANVLIFERLREELKAGGAFSTSVSVAFSRAWSSIRDSNVSTLITCFILAWFGTSMIKGFAITLAIGVMVSMLSSIVITRLWIEIFGRVKWLSDKKWFWGA